MRAMLAALFANRREFRERIEREAADLVTWMGSGAYAEARREAREARKRGDRTETRRWSKIAVEIARRTDQDVGVKGADRYPDPGPKLREPTRNRREIADRLVEISRGIVALSNGSGEATTFHNIGVEARQILDFTGRTPALESAVSEVIAACETIRSAPTIEQLAAGLYPPRSGRRPRSSSSLPSIAPIRPEMRSSVE